MVVLRPKEKYCLFPVTRPILENVPDSRLFILFSTKNHFCHCVWKHNCFTITGYFLCFVGMLQETNLFFIWPKKQMAQNGHSNIFSFIYASILKDSKDRADSGLCVSSFCNKQTVLPLCKYILFCEMIGCHTWELCMCMR